MFPKHMFTKNVDGSQKKHYSQMLWNICLNLELQWKWNRRSIQFLTQPSPLCFIKDFTGVYFVSFYSCVNFHATWIRRCLWIYLDWNLRLCSFVSGQWIYYENELRLPWIFFPNDKNRLPILDINRYWKISQVLVPGFVEIDNCEVLFQDNEYIMRNAYIYLDIFIAKTDH